MRTPTAADPLRVLALGAGVQSSYLYLASCRGELPYLDAAVFADTGNEPDAVYSHLDWLMTEGQRAGIPIIKTYVGDLATEALEFRQNRTSSDGKRHASVPFYVKNSDGSRGQIRRQCTPTYKIEPMERVIREQLLGLKRGQCWRGDVVVEQWIGISHDEARRCSFPGVYVSKKKYGNDLFGERYVVDTGKKWQRRSWKTHTYPLCGWHYRPDRTVTDCRHLPYPMDRTGCMVWLKRYYPGRKFPRSACKICPYRSNAEWRRMRDEDPAEWQEAIQFDLDLRVADQSGQWKRKLLVGLPFVHDSLVPLGEADIDKEDGKVGAGCGVAVDKSGINEGELFVGMCGV